MKHVEVFSDRVDYMPTKLFPVNVMNHGLTLILHNPFSSQHTIQILQCPRANSFVVGCCHNVCH